MLSASEPEADALHREFQLRRPNLKKLNYWLNLFVQNENWGSTYESTLNQDELVKKGLYSFVYAIR